MLSLNNKPRNSDPLLIKGCAKKTPLKGDHDKNSKVKSEEAEPRE